MTDLYTTRPATVTATTNGMGGWDVRHADGRYEFLPNALFEQRYTPAADSAAPSPSVIATIRAAANQRQQVCK